LPDREENAIQPGAGNESRGKSTENRRTASLDWSAGTRPAERKRSQPKKKNNPQWPSRKNFYRNSARARGGDRT